MPYSPPQTPQFEVVYRDDDILVFNKPNGLLTVPGKTERLKDCLQSRAQRIWPTATIVHRLDMATSGLLIMALNKDAHRHISKQFETRQVSKTYYARVLGVPTKTGGIIELPLICDWPNRPKQMVDHEHGKSACTHWQLIENDGETSLIKLKPITGRSHQLRVHMLSIGHEILGDNLYASERGRAMSKWLCLHAFNIAFEHPTSGETLYFETPYLF
jgi:tRNA pseudouridine32 synthase/23S rRNA pseudouridine746 synthase